MKCKHTCWVFDDNCLTCTGPEALRITIAYCLYCGDYMPLGSAVDTPETAIELRAAEITAFVAENPDVTFSKIQADRAEVSGWIIGESNSMRGPDHPGEHAGYLAQVIYSHDTDNA